MSPAYETEERDERGRWTAGGAASATEHTGEDALSIWRDTVVPSIEAGSYQPIDPNAKFTPSELEHAEMNWQTQIGYEEINGFLREGNADPHYAFGGGRQMQGRYGEDFANQQAAHEVEKLDYAIQRSEPTAFPTVLNRSVSGDAAAQYQALQPGETKVDPGYVAATTETGRNLEEFANRAYPNADHSLLEIHAPAGSQGLYISKEEVLLPHGSEMQIVSQDPGHPSLVGGKYVGYQPPTTVVNLVPRK